MKKFKIVIEVEVQEDSQITPEVVKRGWGTYSNYHEILRDPEWLADVEHERALLAALLATPAVYQEYLRADVLSQLESLSFKEVCELAGIKRDSYKVYKDLVETLPQASKEHFQKAIEGDVLSEATYLISACFRVEMRKVTLESND